jgi:hypothetical protein
VLDEDLAHEARRNGEEVGAVFKADGFEAAEVDVSFVHEGGCLKDVAGPLAAEVGRSDPFQFGVEKASDLIERIFIAFLPLIQEFGDLRIHG